MAFKTITIKKDVYDKLAAAKRKDESFSTLLDRLVAGKKTSLREIYGAWHGSDEELDAIEKMLYERRAEPNKRLEYIESLLE